MMNTYMSIHCRHTDTIRICLGSKADGWPSWSVAQSQIEEKTEKQKNVKYDEYEKAKKAKWVKSKRSCRHE